MSAAVSGAFEAIHLHPGQLVTVAHSAVVSTILGSSVAVCLWDPISRTAGMNHFRLHWGQGPLVGNGAMAALLDEMTGRGASVSHLVAKVFGGACISDDRREIAAQNIDIALGFLSVHEIPVTANHTGGTCERRVLFHTGSGFVYVKEV